MSKLVADGDELAAVAVGRCDAAAAAYAAGVCSFGEYERWLSPEMGERDGVITV